MISPKITAQLRRALGHTVKHRVRIVQQGLTSAATDVEDLLKAVDAPDYDIETDGTNVAECETGARIVGMDLKMIIYLPDVKNRVEMMLYRDKDGGVSASFVPTNLFDSDHTPHIENVKRNTVFYDIFIAGSTQDKYSRTLRGFPAMKRVRLMQENDVFRLNFINGTYTNAANWTLVGSITTVK